MVSSPLKLSTVALDDATILLNDPDKVASEGYYAFGSAIWFYMTPQMPKPSMHDVLTGFMTPNSADRAANINNGFGASINIINGGLECNTGTGVESSVAQARINYFTAFCNDFGVSTGANLGCATMGPFTTAGSNNFPE